MCCVTNRKPDQYRLPPSSTGTAAYAKRGATIRVSGRSRTGDALGSLDPTYMVLFGRMGTRWAVDLNLRPQPVTAVPDALLAPTVTARSGWRTRRPIQEMLREDILVTDLFRFDCQLQLKCLANCESTVIACSRSNQRI